jgi:hypothetical protein
MLGPTWLPFYLMRAQHTLRPSMGRQVSSVERSEILVWKEKHLARQSRVERLFAVIGLQNAVFPIQQVRVSRDELFPALSAARSSHPFMNQENVSPGNGLVIEIRFAMHGRKMFQPLGEAGEHFEHRVVAEIQPDHTDVLAMVKVLVRDSARLESFDELSVMHSNYSSLATVTLCSDWAA